MFQLVCISLLFIALSDAQPQTLFGMSIDTFPNYRGPNTTDFGYPYATVQHPNDKTLAYMVGVVYGPSNNWYPWTAYIKWNITTNMQTGSLTTPYYLNTTNYNPNTYSFGIGNNPYGYRCWGKQKIKTGKK